MWGQEHVKKFDSVDFWPICGSHRHMRQDRNSPNLLDHPKFLVALQLSLGSGHGHKSRGRAVRNCGGQVGIG
jgi:hypothetical protein